jgi:hypothetical protein
MRREWGSGAFFGRDKPNDKNLKNLNFKLNRQPRRPAQNNECIHPAVNPVDRPVDRLAAHVAIQQRLGLLPQRRLGVGRADPNHPAVDGKIINPGPVKFPHCNQFKLFMIATMIPMIGAIGFSILYLLLGGGLGGAVLIFIIAKMLGK